MSAASLGGSTSGDRLLPGPWWVALNRWCHLPSFSRRHGHLREKDSCRTVRSKICLSTKSHYSFVCHQVGRELKWDNDPQLVGICHSATLGSKERVIVSQIRSITIIFFRAKAVYISGIFGYHIFLEPSRCIFAHLLCLRISRWLPEWRSGIDHRSQELILLVRPS